MDQAMRASLRIASRAQKHCGKLAVSGKLLPELSPQLHIASSRSIAAQKSSQPGRDASR
jgi:hypothetical protein